MGQGVNLSIEDGGALQILLEDVENPNDLALRIKIFEDIRLPRAAAVQIMSSVPRTQMNTVLHKLEPYHKGEGLVPLEGPSIASLFKYGYRSILLRTLTSLLSY
jgi:hypothetical protein